jgi:cell division protein FtsI/penicillin-binding protein 2
MHRVEANSERRIRWIARIAAVWMLVLGARMVDLQIRQHESIKKQAQHQQERQVGLHGVRGSISDENGQPLAISVPTDSVWVSPARIKRDSNLDTAALVLATGLKMDQTQIRNLILKDPDKRALRIARQVSRRESSDLCGLSRTSGFDYMWCEEEELREHPAGNLAAHVLGPVGRDHSGQYGIERSMETELAGQHGKSRVVVDSASNAYQEQIEQEAKFGTHLRLTLNADIQYAVEQALARQAIKHNVARGTATVLDPRTGAILAMASFPNFELSKPPAKANDPALVNLAVKYPFEPGSVFKTITMAAAIETTDMRPQTLIDCGAGVITIGGFRIRDVHGGGVRTMEAVYANSMNTGSIRVGQRVGSANLRHYIQAFGFGQKTGIELPEEPGYVQPGMQEITRASQSIGYAVNVTSLQLARATAVIANGGLLVKPYLVASRRGPDGVEHVTKPDGGKRIISPETAITMRRMMEAVMLRGTGRRTAKLEGYTSGGKTGTARYYDTQARKYINGKFNASFAGMAPLNDPRIVVVVNYFGTHGEQVGFGGAVAAPVFREIAHASLRILGIPPDPNLMREGAAEQVAPEEEATPTSAPALPAPVTAPRTTSLRPASSNAANDFSLASVPYPLAQGGRQNVSHPDDRGQRSFSSQGQAKQAVSRASRKTEP